MKTSTVVMVIALGWSFILVFKYGGDKQIDGGDVLICAVMTYCTSLILKAME